MEAYRILRCRESYNVIDIQLTDGGEVVSLTRWPCFTPQKHFPILISFGGCQPQGNNVAERIRQIEKKSATSSGLLRPSSLYHNALNQLCYHVPVIEMDTNFIAFLYITGNPQMSEGTIPAQYLDYLLLSLLLCK
jgi:hypothetical protein